MTDIKAVLHDRGKEYGDYGAMCTEIQRLKNLFRAAPSWNAMTDTERETLDSMALKMGRILVGNPHFLDSWDDLAGYATKMAEQLALDLPKIAAPEEIIAVIWRRPGFQDWHLDCLPREEFLRVRRNLGPLAYCVLDGAAIVNYKPPQGKLIVVYQQGADVATRREVEPN